MLIKYKILFCLKNGLIKQKIPKMELYFLKNLIYIGQDLMWADKNIARIELKKYFLILLNV